MSLGLLTGIKAWFAAASVGTKVGAITAGVVVAAGAVATPMVIIGSQANNNDKNTDNSNGSSVNLNGGQELSAEQQAYCESMLEYMTNNNGKVPEGENREEVVKMCYGESGNTTANYAGTATFSSLEEASQIKWEAEHCTYHYKEATGALVDMVCDTARPWGQPENVTTIYNLQLQYCADWNEERTQPMNIDCSAHGADWVNEIWNELSEIREIENGYEVISSPSPYDLIELIPGTEHSYRLYEGDPSLNIPNELLRTDCEYVVETVPATDWDNDGNVIREYETTQEYWVCPILKTNDIFE